jgi:hypothetical protein
MKWELVDGMKGTGRMQWNERKQENEKKNKLRKYLK